MIHLGARSQRKSARQGPTAACARGHAEQETRDGPRRTKEEDSWSSEAGRLEPECVNSFAGDKLLSLASTTHSPSVYRAARTTWPAKPSTSTIQPLSGHSSQTPAQEKETTSNTVQHQHQLEPQETWMAERVREPPDHTGVSRGVGPCIPTQGGSLTHHWTPAIPPPNHGWSEGVYLPSLHFLM